MAFWTNHRWGITFFIGIEHRVLLNHYFLQDYQKFKIILIIMNNQSALT